MDSLTLSIDTLTVDIVKADTFTIKYQDCKPEDFEITYGDNVTITQINPGRTISINRFSLFFKKKEIKLPKIQVGVPDLKKLSAEIDSGCLRISNLNIDQLDLDLDSGVIKLEQVKVQNAKILCDSGLVNIEQLKVANICDIDVDSGKLTLKDSITDQCGYDIKCDSGITKLFGAVKLSSHKHWKKDGSPLFHIRVDSGMCTVK
ncbi:DUF4097 family beta strand repeat-containing protein [Lactobacillus psittaci]|uniref:DUF4097 domain-containing protein n=1 Tax=Lactobacillus psittaci DSM 15354 TaxID=1122152 RepID=A0A0R1S7E7_9LACO|nr:DUF4097 family beta strand repeat-containing protein [Lactobacillus psittaci]KRL62762.1 hypothetical protein FC23_GL001233 [Lactobacillus psittaci DSM 15354]